MQIPPGGSQNFQYYNLPISVNKFQIYSWNVTLMTESPSQVSSP
jgi:hypothetical protein